MKPESLQGRHPAPKGCCARSARSAGRQEQLKIPDSHPVRNIGGQGWGTRLILRQTSVLVLLRIADVLIVPKSRVEIVVKAKFRFAVKFDCLDQFDSRALTKKLSLIHISEPTRPY